MGTVAYMQGRNARDNGKPTSDNPYLPFVGNFYKHWQKGWYDRHEEISKISC